jgi:hypothetical protein
VAVSHPATDAAFLKRRHSRELRTAPTKTNGTII